MTTFSQMIEEDAFPSSEEERYPGSLSKEEQQHLLIHLAHPDIVPAQEIEHARASLFEEYQSLARSLARRYCPRSNLAPLPDLIQDASKGCYCLHGAGNRGCLQLCGQYVSFPSLQDAQNMVHYFRANSWSARQHMNGRVSQQVYMCLNAHEQSHVA